MSAVFSWINAIDGATISATNQAPNMLAQNLTDPKIQKCWRALATSATFTAQFSPTTIEILALAGCTLNETDSIRHRVYDADGNLLYDATVDADVVPGYGLHFHLLDDEYLAAKWVCDITANSRVSQGFFDIGRAWAGPIWSPGIGMTLGWSDGWNDTTPVRRGRFSGASFPGQGVQYRVINFTLDRISETDRHEAMELSRYAGTRNQFLFVPDAAGDWARRGMIGRFASMPRVSQPIEVSPEVFSQTFEIQQDL